MTESVHERTPFARENSQGQRSRNASRVRQAYKDRIPVIMAPHPDYATTRRDDDREPPWAMPFTRNKFIAPNEQTFGRFVAMVRLHYANVTSPIDAILFCVWSRKRGWIVPPMNMLMSRLDDEFRSPDDGLLYVYYCEENVFGER